MARAVAPDVDRFRANKGRVTDFYEHNADAIRDKRTLLASAGVFAEMRWLCEEITRLGGAEAIDDPARFTKIVRFVLRVCEEQAGAVRTGQFVKVRADFFGAWRFLVRALEATLKRQPDLYDPLGLGERLADEHTDRIVLDLEDGLGDDGPEEEQPKRPRPRPRPAAGGSPRVSGLGLGKGGGDDDLPGGDQAE